MAHQASTTHTAQDTEQPAAVLLKVVEELTAELHPSRFSPQALTLDRDLGLDSLARVELFARIERRFGVALPDQTFASAQTPRDLLRAVLAARTSGTPFAAAPISTKAPDGVEATPHSAQTLVEVLDWYLHTHPDRTHILLYDEAQEGERVTYRQLHQGAQAVAVGLQQRGMLPGEPVAIMLPTGRDYFFGFFGILLAGGVPVPLYPPVRPDQLEDHLRRQRGILASCQAVTLITVPKAKNLARLMRSHVTSLQHLVTVDELSATPGSYRAPVLGPQDIALLQYTSGSTGNPKGVVLTHANLLTNIRTMGEAVQANSTDVFVSWLPLYHDMGLIGAWLGSLYYAARLVIMSPLAFLLRPQRWLWAIHQHRATLSAAPNFAYELCLRHIQDEDIAGLDLSSWRQVFNGAEPVSPDTLQRFSERFARYGFRREAMMPVYGLAESSVGLAFPPLGRGPLIDRIQREAFTHHGRAIAAADSDSHALRFVACGRPLPGHEIRIIAPDGHELPERQEGRMQFRGPSATGGYYRNPEETRRLFQGDWLDSGDLAYIAEGDIYITGRIKDVIIRAGRNIYPHELEEAVGDTPGIRKGRVAAFGSADPDTGTERLVVLAETREQDPLALERLRSEIIATATDLTGAPPDEVVLAPPGTVLKTSSGKIRRAASRERYERGHIGRRPKAVWWQITRLALSALPPQSRRLRRTLVAGLYAVYTRALLWVLAPLVWLAVALLPRLAWRWAVVRTGARCLAYTSATPLSIEGLERLPPPEQPCVVVSNHASYLDSAALVASIPRRLSFVAKAELAERFVPRTFLRRIGARFVERFDRQQGVTDARQVAQALHEGQTLAFFPEGTFTRAPGLLPFHMGAFVIAAEAHVPIVPVAIRGTRSILRSDLWMVHHGAIRITVGEPIDPRHQQAPDSWAMALKLRDAARETILRHCGEPDLAQEKSPI